MICTTLDLACFLVIWDFAHVFDDGSFFCVLWSRILHVFDDLGKMFFMIWVFARF